MQGRRRALQPHGSGFIWLVAPRQNLQHEAPWPSRLGFLSHFPDWEKMQNCARTPGGWLPAPCHLAAQGAAEAVCCPAAAGSSSRGAGPGGTRAHRGKLTGRALTSTAARTLTHITHPQCTQLRPWGWYRKEQKLS